MSQSNIPDFLRRGIEAAQGGNRQGARQFFRQALNLDAECQEGWLWSGLLADSPEEAIKQFYRALAAEADNPTAKAGLEWAMTWLSEGVAPALPSELDALWRQPPPPPAPETGPARIQFDPTLLSQLGSLGQPSAPAEPPTQAPTGATESLFDQWLQGRREGDEPLRPTAPPPEPQVPPVVPPPPADLTQREESTPWAKAPPEPLVGDEPPQPIEAPPTPIAETPVTEPQAEAPVSPEPSLESLQARSEAALADERWEEAAALLEELTEQSPSGKTHQKLGVALYHLGQKEKALTQFEAALHLEPERAEPYANLGFIYQELGQLERAEEFLKQAVTRDEAMVEAQVALGQVLNGQGKLEDATWAWEAATDLRPDLPQLQVSLGETWAALGNYKAAAVAFERALALQPDLPGVAEKLKTVAEVSWGKRLLGIFSRGKR